jgi:hypothetical protein
MPRYAPPPVEIPKDYAPLLGVARSFIRHVNTGNRRFSPDNACKLLRLAREKKDQRLNGLTIFHLRPEAEIFVPEICELCPLKKKTKA